MPRGRWPIICIVCLCVCIEFGDKIGSVAVKGNSTESISVWWCGGHGNHPESSESRSVNNRLHYRWWWQTGGDVTRCLFLNNGDFLRVAPNSVSGIVGDAKAMCFSVPTRMSLVPPPPLTEFFATRVIVSAHCRGLSLVDGFPDFYWAIGGFIPDFPLDFVDRGKDTRYSENIITFQSTYGHLLPWSVPQLFSSPCTYYYICNNVILFHVHITSI